MFTEGECGGGGREGAKGKGEKGIETWFGGVVAETWQSRYERHSGQGGWEKEW